MEGVVIRAIGTYGQGRVELEDGEVRIIRGKNVLNIPVDRIVAIDFQAATPWRNGHIYFAVADESGQLNGFADSGARTVRFLKRQQGPFDQIRELLEQGVDQHPKAQTPPLQARTQHTADVVAGSDARANDHLAAEAPPVALPRAGDEMLIARLAEIGEVALSMLGDTSKRDATALTDMLARSREELSHVVGWAALAEQTPHPDPIGDYLTRVARSLASRAAARLDEAGVALASRRMKTRGLIEHMHENLEESLRAQVCAASLLMVRDALTGYGENAHVKENLTSTETYDVMVRNLAVMVEQLKTITHDPTQLNTEVFEALYPGIAAGLQSLHGAIEGRSQGLKSLHEEERVEGDEYLLHCARTCWKVSLTALGRSRQEYIGARTRWSARFREVIEDTSSVLAELVAGQATVCMFDAYLVPDTQGSGMSVADAPRVVVEMPPPSAPGRSTSGPARSTSGPALDLSAPQFCYSCGAHTRTGAKFCVQCGVPLKE